jgi:hypothetical protein
MAALRITFLVVLLVAVSFLAFRDPNLLSSCEAPGAFDYIQYYASNQLLLAGQDPYDRATMSVIQEELCGEKTFVVGMYTPPWLLLYLKPILSFDFSNSALSWMVLNFLFLSIIVFVICRQLAPPVSIHPLIVGAALLFAPVLYSLQMGQISIFLCLFFCLFLVADHNKRFALSGLALVPLSVKPHIFYLFWVYLGWREFKQRRLKLIGTLVLGTIVSVALSEVLLPGGLYYWLNHMQSPPEHFIGGTFVANLRNLSFVLSQDSAPWLLVAVPAIVALLFLFLLIRRGDVVERHDAWCCLMCLSVWSSPYGWSFDYSILLPFQILLVKNLLLSHSIVKLFRSPILWLLAGVNILLLCRTYLGLDAYHFATWFPPMILVFWEWHKKLLNDRDGQQ